uniref:Cytochrome c biogenesis protein Ccs1 n=1 Tax=Laurencieae sp. TaxID=2007162 RepID=A0A1Z1M231_9FLOR|nr:cytochrome c biogenesis protein ccs1 [Laurencieae sp.]
MKTFEVKNWSWNFLKKLANLNLSIFILSLIAIFCVLGSLIEQDQSLSYYQTHYPVYKSNILNFNWQFIDYLGLDHIFQTWWFMLILFIFILTLLSCTFFTQLPSLKNARRWKFVYNKDYPHSKFSFKDSYQVDTYSSIVMADSLVNSSFFVFGQCYSVYAHRGLYGRISPIFVHFSIVAVLLGSMLSFLSGFVAQEIVPNGEIFHIKNVIRSGILSHFPASIFGRVESFKIDYNSDGSIKQFFSKISLISCEGDNIISKIISVNNPLHYHSMTFYQTDWQFNALKIRLADGNTLQKKLFKTVINNRNCWLCNILIDDYNQVFFAIFDLSSPVLVFNSDGLIIGAISINQLFYINNTSFLIDEILTSTGLQIKIDLGISIVYFGFFVLMLSTVLSYLSYSQIWVYRYFNVFQFLASTNRSVLFFEEDIVSINSVYHFRVSSRYIKTNYVQTIILK